MFENEDEWVSKTRMKQQMDELQDLGMALTKLSSDTLKKIGLILLKKVVNFSVFPRKRKCTCPIFSVLMIVVLKPPLSPQNFAAFEAAATTELSSIAIGMV